MLTDTDHRNPQPSLSINIMKEISPPPHHTTTSTPLFPDLNMSEMALAVVYYDDNTSHEWSLVVSVFPVPGKKTDC